MKISVKQLVVLFLGLFLLKIAVADPFRESRNTLGHRSPATLKNTMPQNSTI